jgi:tetrahydromethanopterin S-methyltransferase subunit A
LKSLFENGMDERSCIRGASGRRPVLKNVTSEQVNAFIEQIELCSLISNLDEATIIRAIHECTIRAPGAYQNSPKGNRLEIIQSSGSSSLTLDPAGYFVIYPDWQRRRLAVEHYTNAGVLDCIVEGKTSAATYTTIIDRKLMTRLDHAAYLGRELARAESSLETGTAYIQDQAFGEISEPPDGGSCGCSGCCGGSK